MAGFSRKTIFLVLAAICVTAAILEYVVVMQEKNLQPVSTRSNDEPAQPVSTRSKDEPAQPVSTRSKDEPAQPVSTRSKNDNHNVSATCEYPHLDPHSAKSKTYARHYGPIKCNDLPIVATYDGVHLRVPPATKIRNLLTNIKECHYRNVTHDPKNIFTVGKWSKVFKTSILVEGRPDFVEVECHDEKGKLVVHDHHYVFNQDVDTSRKLHESNTKGRKETPLNVMLIGLDAISSHHYKRTMLKTRQYLNSDLGAVEMNMHNVVEEGSVRNLIVTLTGKHYKEQNWTEGGFCDDSLSMIWSDYKSRGYKTQYAGDLGDFANFRKPPTDSFNFPMSNSILSAPHKRSKANRILNECIGDQVEITVWLKYIKQFILENHAKGQPFFSFSFFSRPTHDLPYKAVPIDAYYKNFFTDLYKANVLNNTFLIFFSDHGARYGAGSYRWTAEGSIEERSPMINVYVPPWFRTVHAKLFENLLQNRNRLTSNFDIHATLKHVLSKNFTVNNNYDSRGKRAVSLLNKIDYNRTCSDATITDHFCLCSGGINSKNPLIKKSAAEAAVGEINKFLKDKLELCHVLKLNTTKNLLHVAGVGAKTESYRVVFITEPGNAAFEATVTFQPKSKTASTDIKSISRVNAYGQQSHCVQERKFKSFCYCKDIKDKSG